MPLTFSSQHTQTLPDFLSQLGISLLVSTYQAGKLIILRHQNGILNTHFVDMQKPMGIALQGAHLAVGTGHELRDYYNMPQAASKLEPPDTHDACFLPRVMHITGDIDIHEMAFTENGELWFVNTRMSCLCTLEKEYSVNPKWRPPFISAYDLTDRCHLNGLATKDGEIAFVSALGTTDSPAGWRKNKANGGMVMDIRNNKMISSGLSMPHSPRWYQDKLWVLESGSGSLATIDVDTGKLTTIIELPGFTRGLDFIGRYAIIGLSQVRETAVFAGLPLTERCQERQCGVYIVDIVEKQVIGFVVFSGDVQEIFSVQIVPANYPAVLSADDPLLHTTYSIPENALENFAQPDEITKEVECAVQCYKKGDLLEALLILQQVIKKYPEHEQAHYNLGVIYCENKNWAKATETFEQLLAFQPKHAEGYNSLGVAYREQQKWEKARENFENAIRIDQQFALAHVNLSLLELTLGNFQKAWKEYEWRWKLPGVSSLSCSQPQWKGEDLTEKALLIHTEQTDSDIIQFSRFISAIKKMCRRLVVLCPEPFRLFFKSIKEVDKVILPNQLDNENFDFYIPLLSIPGVINITPESLNQYQLSLSPPASVIIPKLISEDIKQTIGIYWDSDVFKSADLTLIQELVTSLTVKLPSLAIYSFHTNFTDLERDFFKKNNILILKNEILSYAHTALMIKQMSLIISTEGPVTHLSNSLKIPTYCIYHGDDLSLSIRKKITGIWYPGSTYIQLKKHTIKNTIDSIKLLLTETVA